MIYVFKKRWHTRTQHDSLLLIDSDSDHTIKAHFFPNQSKLMQAGFWSLCLWAANPVILERIVCCQNGVLTWQSVQHSCGPVHR